MLRIPMHVHEEWGEVCKSGNANEAMNILEFRDNKALRVNSNVGQAGTKTMKGGKKYGRTAALGSLALLTMTVAPVDGGSSTHHDSQV